MPWVKLDDSFAEHPKVEAAGDQAAWLYVCGLLYCSRTLSDGFIPTRRVRRLCGLRAPFVQAQRLVDVGLWESVEGGYEVHAYVEHQRSKAQVERDREKAAERQARFRRQSRNGRSNDVTNETRGE